MTKIARRVAGLLLCCTGLLALQGCDVFRREFTVATFPTDYITSLTEVAAIMSAEVRLQFASRTLANDEDKLALLTSGEIDFTFISNSTPYQEGVFAVMPLYKDVLHIFYRKDAVAVDAASLLLDKLVYTDPGSKALQRMLDIFVTSAKIGPDEFRVTHNLDDKPDVILHFAPLLSRDFSRLKDDYRLFNIATPDQLGKGSQIEGMHYVFPQIQTFIIPAQVYGELNPYPVVTFSVDNILVTNGNTPSLIVYWLCQTIARYRNIFAENYPAVFDYVGKDFDPSMLNFPLHPGARAYLDRDEPTFLERYAEVINTLLYCLALIISGFYALGKWNDLRKKNRIDVYYAQLLNIRRRAQHDTHVAAGVMLAEIQQLENEAISLLIDEKLTANESMTILLVLAQMISAEIKNRGGTH